MKKIGAKPQVLLAVGSLALAMTSCRENDSQTRPIESEQVTEHLLEHGFRPAENQPPSSYLDTDGNLVTEEEALKRTGRTVRRGFGRFLFAIGG